ncbi:glycosyltransferase family 1 protein [Anabaena sphaerica FACHB-251]|uniref:Glycosyltransferase family 1 protein n=1 Tax=Anabaena sphaerica FACHB-251 TaxID=2692883 RepID=A0A926WF24_9NOST|nr:glycosyltransferase [Anabaena sphaerica]MBD2293364.1 glycosyltransferase family 1 protein [Anabaena sphaerica FACHB-251]
MNITILTWGSDGDLIPYIALGLGLQRAGHLVKIATTIYAKDLVTQWGLEFIPVDCKAWYKDFLVGSHQNPFVIAEYYNYVLQPVEESFLPILKDVCSGAEAIIFSPPAFAAFELLEKLGIPGYAACVVPLHPTRAFSNHFTPTNWQFGGTYNWLTYTFFNQLLWQYIQKPINQWRQEILQLPPVSRFADPLSRMCKAKIPFIYGYSPAFVPKPFDWPDWVNVTGYWFLDKPKNWQPPQDLVDFIAADSPPVYIGFGYKAGWDQKALMKLSLEALALSGQRGIVLMGDDLTNEFDLPDEVFPIEWVPFDWLFPQMAAVVHHGGCGTVAAALGAGVPNIIVPYNYDNFFWSYRISDLGIGSQPLHFKNLTPEKLAVAIKAVVNDKVIQNKVMEMSKSIQAEDGVPTAVELIQHYLGIH